MAVSIANIPKNTNVYRFITSGKRGFCELCNKEVQKLEAHHISYDPEKTIKLCHLCHHKIHFWPNRLTEFERYKVLKKRFDIKTSAKLSKKKFLGIDALARLIAPSRSLFVREQQKKEKEKLRSEKQKLYKEVGINNFKRIGRKKIKAK